MKEHENQLGFRCSKYVCLNLSVHSTEPFSSKQAWSVFATFLVKSVICYVQIQYNPEYKYMARALSFSEISLQKFIDFLVS
jgi:hypothetical protein